MNDFKPHDYSKLAHSIFEVFQIIKYAVKENDKTHKMRFFYFNQFLVRTLSISNGCKQMSFVQFTNIQQDIISYFTMNGSEKDVESIKLSLYKTTEHFYGDRPVINTYEIKEDNSMLVFELIVKAFSKDVSKDYSKECINKAIELSNIFERDDIVLSIKHRYF